MKLTNLTTALFLVTSACGAVIDPTQDPGQSTDEMSFDEPPVNGDIETETPPAPPPLLIDAPHAATSASSLFAMTFEANYPIENVVVAEERARIDVVEQKIVTTTNQEIELVLELAAVTGTYSRVLVSDTIQNGGTYADRVVCEYNGFATYDPRCESVAPAKREIPSSGPLTTSQWKLRVVDEVTGDPIASCIPAGTNKLSCVLPARAAASYQIIASAYGFADLWDGSPGFGPYVMGPTPFVGANATESEWQCWDFPHSGATMYCGARYEFRRFTAIDRARLELDPISIKITANGNAAASMATPALTWDAGNDDVPGPNY